jgi:DNA-binding SARP family transcriptional activator
VGRRPANVVAAAESSCDFAVTAHGGPTPRRIDEHFTLTLLSGFELRQNGTSISLPLPSQRLLAFLALQGQPVLRPFVAGTLWLDSSEENAAASLRSALWRVRRRGYELVEVTKRHIGLSPRIDVDVQATVTWAYRMLRPEVEIDTADVRRATGFGELLPDWYDDWLVIERERLRQMGLHTLENLCERLTCEGRFAEALEVGLAAVRCEPLRESAHRVIIEIHVREGNVAEAIRHYRFYSRLLRDQLGLAPSDSLQELMRAFHTRMTFR